MAGSQKHQAERIQTQKESMPFTAILGLAKRMYGDRNQNWFPLRGKGTDNFPGGLEMLGILIWVVVTQEVTKLIKL